MPPLNLWALPALAPGHDGARPLGGAVVLTATIVLLLAVFFIGALLLVRSVQRGRSQRKYRLDGTGRRAVVDPWREAGRRLTPPQAPGDSPPAGRR